MMRHAEDSEQRALLSWARLRSATWPELELLHHVPNGGRRDAREAGRLKAQGVKAGVPDLCLPVARGVHHGLYVELKRADQKTNPTAAQRWWLDRLREQGYRAEVCRGWDEARRVIEEYLREAT
jgi:hypothetical protein